MVKIRISGYTESALEAGLAAAGLSASFTGPIPAPAVAYLTRTFRAEAGIVISAYHNPYYDNGSNSSLLMAQITDEVEEAIEAEMENQLPVLNQQSLVLPNQYRGCCVVTLNSMRTFPNENNLNVLKSLSVVLMAQYHIAKCIS